MTFAQKHRVLMQVALVLGMFVILRDQDQHRAQELAAAVVAIRAMRKDIAEGVREYQVKLKRTRQERPDTDSIASVVLAKHFDDKTAPVAVRTLRTWFAEFKRHGGFKEDCRGSWTRPDAMGLVDGLVVGLQAFVRAEKHPTVDLAQRFINDHLAKAASVDPELGKALETLRIDCKKGICRVTTHVWMLRVGCEYKASRQCYYTDAHNRYN